MQSGVRSRRHPDAESGCKPIAMAVVEPDRDVLPMIRRSLERRDVRRACQPVVTAGIVPIAWFPLP